MEKEKKFSCCVFEEEYSKNCIAQSLKECNENKLLPIFVCVGSDLILGDSLGPLVGTLLKNKGINNYIYGTLATPITAKEVNYLNEYLNGVHKNTVFISVDAAVGNENDVGLIKICNKGLKPGLGVNKNLKTVGDISIIGVVAEKSINNRSLFYMTRLNLIYKMARIIAEGVEKYLTENFNNNKYYA